MTTKIEDEYIERIAEQIQIALMQTTDDQGILLALRAENIDSLRDLSAHAYEEALKGVLLCTQDS